MNEQAELGLAPPGDARLVRGLFLRGEIRGDAFGPPGDVRRREAAFFLAAEALAASWVSCKLNNATTMRTVR